MSDLVATLANVRRCRQLLLLEADAPVSVSRKAAAAIAEKIYPWRSAFFRSAEFDAMLPDEFTQRVSADIQAGQVRFFGMPLRAAWS